MMRKFIALSFVALLGGCTSLASGVSGLTVALSSATPTQAATVAQAAQIATLAEQAVDLYVKTGTASQPTLAELKVLLTDLHTPLVAAETANANGNSAAAAAGVSAFNEALAAYQAYSTKAGVAQ